jgi:hypothetical protein
MEDRRSEHQKWAVETPAVESDEPGKRNNSIPEISKNLFFKARDSLDASVFKSVQISTRTLIEDLPLQGGGVELGDGDHSRSEVTQVQTKDCLSAFFVCASEFNG